MAPKKKNPIIPSIVNTKIDRPQSDVVSQLSEFPTTIISDCLNRMNNVGSTFRPMGEKQEFCGPAFTVEEVEAGNLMSHLALNFVKKGDVLVIDAKGITSRSCWGGLQTFAAKCQGVAAIVINGVIRDIDAVNKYKIAVFALGTSPAGPMKGWGGHINRCISFPGIAISPGDIIRGDADGIVVIPKDIVKNIIPLCKERIRMEDKWFDKVKNGENTVSAVGLNDKFKELGIDIDSIKENEIE
tara:strand:- start:1052 stop:1777 length:726 start_codon:yes stop_codon:yes gene_type:complete